MSTNVICKVQVSFTRAPSKPCIYFFSSLRLLPVRIPFLHSSLEEVLGNKGKAFSLPGLSPWVLTAFATLSPLWTASIFLVNSSSIFLWYESSDGDWNMVKFFLINVCVIDHHENWWTLNSFSLWNVDGIIASNFTLIQNLSRQWKEANAEISTLRDMMTCHCKGGPSLTAGGAWPHKYLTPPCVKRGLTN